MVVTSLFVFFLRVESFVITSSYWAYKVSRERVWNSCSIDHHRILSYLQHIVRPGSRCISTLYVDLATVSASLSASTVKGGQLMETSWPKISDGCCRTVLSYSCIYCYCDTGISRLNVYFIDATRCNSLFFRSLDRVSRNSVCWDSCPTVECCSCWRFWLQ